MNKQMREVVVLSGARTATGKFGKSLSGIDAPKIGAMALREAINRSKLKDENIDEVIIGTHFQAGIKANSARQCAIYAGMPQETPAFTPNKNCATALKAICLAAQSIMVGDNDVVAAGGCECMSRIPYVLNDARFGYRMGHGELRDSMLYDGLVDPFCNYHMGITAENVAKKYGITREMQDRWAVRSHNLAQQAWESGKFSEDIVPVKIKVKKEEVLFDKDETYIENASYENFAKMKPVFKEDGTVTVANASPINDAAAVLVLANADVGRELGIEPLAKYITSASAATDPAYMGYTPVYAVQKLLKKT